jgi:hypothetical protein
MKRLLVQTQLSNINYKHNKFDLACDSGWQMVMGRVREMLDRNPDLDITVMCPNDGESGEENQLVEHPVDISKVLWEKHGQDGDNRLHFFHHYILPNALVTRFDFDWSGLACGLDLGMQKIGRAPKFDAVYINDPMHLRNFKAMFHVIGGYQPRFCVHSHFVDVPEVPKFPQECSLWLGQCEAALRADYNFWQCESAMLQFYDSMGKWFTQDVVDDVRAKSLPWDDGYSMMETTDAVDEGRMRFTPEQWKEKTEGKVVLFFPNRISPSSGDYTNGMKFMFEVLPKLRQLRQDFVVVCGNPNQKFSNKELEEKCGANGYIKLTEDTFDRNEYKFVARNSDIALGLYNADPYGGTAARECVELGCMPLWLDNYEYSSLAREAGISHFLAWPDLSNLVDKTSYMIDYIREFHRTNRSPETLHGKLLKVVRDRCSYEATTPAAMRRMGLLDP